MWKKRNGRRLQNTPLSHKGTYHRSLPLHQSWKNKKSQTQVRFHPLHRASIIHCHPLWLVAQQEGLSSCNQLLSGTAARQGTAPRTVGNSVTPRNAGSAQRSKLAVTLNGLWSQRELGGSQPRQVLVQATVCRLCPGYGRRRAWLVAPTQHC